MESLGVKELRDLLRRYGVDRTLLRQLVDHKVDGAAFLGATHETMAAWGVASRLALAQLQRLQSLGVEDYDRLANQVPEEQAAAAEALDEFYRRRVEAGDAEAGAKVGKGVQITNSFSDDPALLYQQLKDKHPEADEALREVFMPWAVWHQDQALRQDTAAKALRAFLDEALAEMASSGTFESPVYKELHETPTEVLLASFTDAPARLLEYFENWFGAEASGFLEKWVAGAPKLRRAAMAEAPRDGEGVGNPPVDTPTPVDTPAASAAAPAPRPTPTPDARRERHEAFIKRQMANKFYRAAEETRLKKERAAAAAADRAAHHAAKQKVRERMSRQAIYYPRPSPKRRETYRARSPSPQAPKPTTADDAFADRLTAMERRLSDIRHALLARAVPDKAGPMSVPEAPQTVSSESVSEGKPSAVIDDAAPGEIAQGTATLDVPEQSEDVNGAAAADQPIPTPKESASGKAPDGTQVSSQPSAVAAEQLSPTAENSAQGTVTLDVPEAEAPGGKASNTEKASEDVTDAAAAEQLSPAQQGPSAAGKVSDGAQGASKPSTVATFGEGAADESWVAAGEGAAADDRALLSEAVDNGKCEPVSGREQPAADAAADRAMQGAHGESDEAGAKTPRLRREGGTITDESLLDVITALRAEVADMKEHLRHGSPAPQAAPPAKQGGAEGHIQPPPPSGAVPASIPLNSAPPSEVVVPGVPSPALATTEPPSAPATPQLSALSTGGARPPEGPEGQHVAALLAHYRALREAKINGNRSPRASVPAPPPARGALHRVECARERSTAPARMCSGRTGSTSLPAGQLAFDSDLSLPRPLSAELGAQDSAARSRTRHAAPSAMTTDATSRSQTQRPGVPFKQPGLLDRLARLDERLRGRADTIQPVVSATPHWEHRPRPTPPPAYDTARAMPPGHDAMDASPKHMGPWCPEFSASRAATPPRAVTLSSPNHAPVQQVMPVYVRPGAGRAGWSPSAKARVASASPKVPSPSLYNTPLFTHPRYDARPYTSHYTPAPRSKTERDTQYRLPSTARERYQTPPTSGPCLWRESYDL